MSWTEAQRDVLTASIARGVLTVEYDGRRITYQSVDQMLKVLREMDSELNSDFDGPVGSVYTTFTRE